MALNSDFERQAICGLFSCTHGIDLQEEYRDFHLCVVELYVFIRIYGRILRTVQLKISGL